MLWFDATFFTGMKIELWLWLPIVGVELFRDCGESNGSHRRPTVLES